jgi:hypothetical protein
MEFDYKKTLELIKGGLLDHQATWTSYLEENPDWRQTAIVLTGPMIITSVILTSIFSRMVGGYSYYGYGMGFFQGLLLGLVMAAAGIAIGSFVLSILAGTFGGKPSFPRALAALSLAAIPGFLAGIVGSLIPYLGPLISLAGGILTLVFLYKIIPLALDVPEGKRVMHFILSLVGMFVANMILSYTLGFGSARDIRSFDRTGHVAGEGAAGRSVQNAGVLGEIERFQQLQEAAGEDVYEPPGNGKLERSQVVDYVTVMKKTRAVHEDYQEQMESMRKEMEGKDEATVADLTKMYSGMGSAFGAQNAEMEIVLTRGGNWAEHVWVKEQLRVAKIQQGEGSGALEHNYELYQEFASELR